MVKLRPKVLALPRLCVPFHTLLQVSTHEFQPASEEEEPDAVRVEAQLLLQRFIAPLQVAVRVAQYKRYDQIVGQQIQHADHLTQPSTLFVTCVELLQAELLKIRMTNFKNCFLIHENNV